jgi:hypothetical protein
LFNVNFAKIWQYCIMLYLYTVVVCVKGFLGCVLYCNWFYIYQSKLQRLTLLTLALGKIHLILDTIICLIVTYVELVSFSGYWYDIHLNIVVLKSKMVFSIQHYVIKFVSDLRQISGFLWVLQFPPSIKLI